MPICKSTWKVRWIPLRPICVSSSSLALALLETNLVISNPQVYYLYRKPKMLLLPLAPTAYICNLYLAFSWILPCLASWCCRPISHRRLEICSTTCNKRSSQTEPPREFWSPLPSSLCRRACPYSQTSASDLRQFSYSPCTLRTALSTRYSVPVNGQGREQSL
jgi:hypothetical protein